MAKNKNAKRRQVQEEVDKGSDDHLDAIIAMALGMRDVIRNSGEEKHVERLREFEAYSAELFEEICGRAYNTSGKCSFIHSSVVACYQIELGDNAATIENADAKSEDEAPCDLPAIKAPDTKRNEAKNQLKRKREKHTSNEPEEGGKAKLGVKGPTKQLASIQTRYVSASV
jgi:hypothetical protein